ncbi:MAG: hypothetical protein G01um101416_283 [Microgenomates group bacterium Gr01-1014_16]|nr:MAG: hypothetical protein G01um101416_283 [Microgenomates group bacterium Gr01-1014_16]
MTFDDCRNGIFERNTTLFFEPGVFFHIPVNVLHQCLVYDNVYRMSRPKMVSRIWMMKKVVMTTSRPVVACNNCLVAD